MSFSSLAICLVVSADDLQASISARSSSSR